MSSPKGVASVNGDVRRHEKSPADPHLAPGQLALDDTLDDDDDRCVIMSKSPFVLTAHYDRTLSYGPARVMEPPPLPGNSLSLTLFCRCTK